ncbi:hypothetical protein PHSY_000429 [Pseudozyma hubeiensis SY62]|uniref:Uncharacterized protein n=1 Tax=Pseudozyma hubeiensis (strain SY62) TaxID=1305764 RepID=R9NWJ6_PSEHS|nr:hypothetical protein PHSY_000429 [Pseudozyma hubeiensis SY62]GAC92871.1 hypothetical protein PHSY_000429 [Pseudozyma hubeiensis SY62]
MRAAETGVDQGPAGRTRCLFSTDLSLRQLPSAVARGPSVHQAELVPIVDHYRLSADCCIRKGIDRQRMMEESPRMSLHPFLLTRPRLALFPP